MIYEFKGMKPEIADDVFTAPGSKIIGNITIKKGASIWYNTVVRGDIGSIIIGEKTNIQENASLHIDSGQPMKIGKNVTVGHGAILHGCEIENNCIIGMGATILNGAVIGEGSIIGAGALVAEGKTIPPGSLVVGVPGKIIKKLNKENIKQIQESAEHYYHTAQEHSKMLKNNK